MADFAAAPARVRIAADASSERHSAMVRATHWVATFCFFALLVSGLEIVVSHPRFYWGETGNVMTAPLFTIPIPASRSTVPTGYGYVMPDQNGWSRSLHFQSAWLVVFTGLLYVLAGIMTGHFQRNLVPRGLSARSLSSAIRDHLRWKSLRSQDASSYNVLQRLAYLSVVFVLFPLVVWTGMAMSPGVAAGFPGVVTSLGGQQSARTIHFFVTIALVMFFAVHVAMICFAGFGSRMRAMITGSKEHA